MLELVGCVVHRLGRVTGVGGVQDGDVEAGVLERGGLGDRPVEGLGRAVEDVGGADDLGGVPADLVAALSQPVEPGLQALGRAAGVVPVVGVLGDQRQRPLGAGAADDDGRRRLLGTPWARCGRR